MYLYAVSLGGCISTHYLINDDANTPFSGAVTYGTPMNPVMTAKPFKERLWGLYDWGLGLSLNLKVRKVLPQLQKHCSKEKGEIFRKGLYDESFRLTAFDENMIAPMFGYKDAMDYYKHGTVSGLLHKITRCPTMFLEGNDDPLMIPESFPRDEIAKNPNLLLALTNNGGHCCHLTHSERKVFGLAALDWISWFFPSSSWFAGPIIDFFDTIERQHLVREQGQNKSAL
eukprot:Macronucleus_2933.p1 GENE.Macronucleus_2933~~Macronucleus_2933.p1  ORF type:complete len:228 (+),score=34.25 Macronucleus_2933:1-684(+)